MKYTDEPLASYKLLLLVALSCKKDSNPTTPPSDFTLVGRWVGTIGWVYGTTYPLSLRFDKETNDSLIGQMIIGFPGTPDTVFIRSALYFGGDSLQYNLDHQAGLCAYQSMWGKVVNADSLAGYWNYYCINDPPWVSAWSARRKK